MTDARYALLFIEYIRPANTESLHADWEGVRGGTAMLIDGVRLTR